MSHDQVVKWAKAKACVSADSVLCMGQMSYSKDTIARSEGQVKSLLSKN